MDFATFERVARDSSSEEGVFARFYDRAVKSNELGENGLPKFKMICFCEIRIKDNNCEVFDQPATPDKIKRFPAEYARYQLGKKQVKDGTPLEQFAFLSAAEVETLKIHGIFTVETLAELPKEKAVQCGLENEKALAMKFLEQAHNNAAIADWQKKEEEYRHKIALLEEEIASLKTMERKGKRDEKHFRDLPGRG